jgi:hypothetical protein
MKKLKLVGAAVALLALGTGIAYGAGAVASDPIHACVNPAGVVKIVDATVTCSRSETALTWNTAGPAGPPGELGPPGPAGTDGSNASVAAFEHSGAFGVINGVFPAHDTVATLTLPAGAYMLTATIEALMTDDHAAGGSNVTADGLCEFDPNLAGGAHLANTAAGGFAGAQTVQEIHHVTLTEAVQLSSDGDVSLQCSKFQGSMSVTHAQIDAVQVGAIFHQ